jgi:hypothetical protein
VAGWVLVVGVVLLIVGGVMAFMYDVILGKSRNEKGTERGLEMVPLLINLPPISDDTAIGGRDERDVVDETISKAQIIYNIIASTAAKDRDYKRYGQRHIAFEIIGHRGFVNFYAGVPATLVDVVKQAIISAYPSASLEQVAEPNIFNEVGGIVAVAGGDMALKEPYAFPIATYQELKRDALQSVLGTLTSLNKEDGVAVQILFRPTGDDWRKEAADIASKKRKGRYTNKTGLQALTPIMKQMVTALNKPPEEQKASSPENDLSSVDRSTIEAIEDKTRHPGFEVTIRLVVSSNISQRAQSLLQNIVASFSLYDAPGKNGFEFKPSTDIQALVDDYLLRTFVKQKSRMILNSVELATLFHFPDQNKMPTSQVTRQASKQVDGPRDIPEEGMLLGYNVFRGVKKPIRLSQQDRQRHMYAVGQTGTGKSTFLEDLALQDMLNGNGFAFVDPHGDTAEKLLSMVPKERIEDVIYFSPADMDFPLGLNLFEFHSNDQKDFIIQEVLNMLYKLYDPQHTGIMGPRYEDMFRNAALAVMADPNGGTFIEIPQLFRDPAFLKQKLQHVKDQTVLDFWQKQFPAQQRSNEAGEVTAWFVSKFGAFLSNEMMRNIIGQTKSAFDLRDVMDNKKILIVNLSKGRTGDLNSKLLGMIFVMKFQAAAMSRSNVPESERVDFCLYVDEFQNFSTDSFATIMSEARKFHLNLIVANQFTTQLTEEIRDAVFGNMGTIVSFRIGQNDVEALSKYFQPAFDGDDLLRVPNYNTIVRTLINGVPTQPFSMMTLPPLGNPNPKLSDALKQLSAVKHGKPRKVIEEEIFARMKTALPEPAPASRPFGPTATSPWGQSTPPATQQQQQTANPYQPPAAASAAPKPAASFLDEWLEKRKQPKLEVPKFTPPKPITPPPAAAAPATEAPSAAASQPAAETATKNISSEQLDQTEIGKIAEQLKQDLGVDTDKKKPKKEKVTPKPAQPANASGVVIDRSEKSKDKPKPAPRRNDEDPEDTISIDAEGNLVPKEHPPVSEE